MVYSRWCLYMYNVQNMLHITCILHNTHIYIYYILHIYYWFILVVVYMRNACEIYYILRIYYMIHIYKYITYISCSHIHITHIKYLYKKYYTHIAHGPCPLHMYIFTHISHFLHITYKHISCSHLTHTYV